MTHKDDFYKLADDARAAALSFATMPFAEEYDEWREMYEALEQMYLEQAQEASCNM